MNNNTRMCAVYKQRNLTVARGLSLSTLYVPSAFCSMYIQSSNAVNYCHTNL